MGAALPVWGLPVRLMHWLLVAALAAAWVFASDPEGNLHVVAGYAAAGTIAMRLLWGACCGPRSARVARWWRAPRQLPRYWKAWRRGEERRFLGHNPMGSLMACALLLSAALTAFTGWLYTTDRFWGYGWLALLHHMLAWSVIVLAALHVGGAAWGSIRHRENLVLAMITGNKPRRTPRV